MWKVRQGPRHHLQAVLAMNPVDDIRDKILRFLYERHKNSRSINKLPIGIQELQREMKQRHGLKQPEATSNLDYLVQVGWVRRDEPERTFKTRRMELSLEQLKDKSLRRIHLDK
jgi:DNA-binding MarR family transcriptional regulator